MAELQLRRTTGTVYGELMRDSGISLPDGRYITGIDFALGLVNGGVVARRSIRPTLEDVWNSTYYGLKDNKYTGVQIVRISKKKNIKTQNTQYTFNPWREIMGGDETIMDTYDIFGALASPRKIADKLQQMYKLFVALPKSMQEDFLHELDCAPCDLDNTAALDLSPSQLRIYSQILGHVPAQKRDDAVDMLKLMSAHNICVDKGDIVRREIDHLMGFDVSRVPTRWRKGTLDEAVLTEERIRELKGLLQREKIRTS